MPKSLLPFNFFFFFFVAVINGVGGVSGHTRKAISLSLDSLST